MKDDYKINESIHRYEALMKLNNHKWNRYKNKIYTLHHHILNCLMINISNLTIIDIINQFNMKDKSLKNNSVYCMIETFHPPRARNVRTMTISFNEYNLELLVLNENSYSPLLYLYEHRMFEEILIMYYLKFNSMCDKKGNEVND